MPPAPHAAHLAHAAPRDATTPAPAPALKTAGRATVQPVAPAAPPGIRLDEVDRPHAIGTAPDAGAAAGRDERPPWPAFAERTDADVDRQSTALGLLAHRDHLAFLDREQRGS